MLGLSGESFPFFFVSLPREHRWFSPPDTEDSLVLHSEREREKRDIVSSCNVGQLCIDVKSRCAYNNKQYDCQLAVACQATGSYRASPGLCNGGVLWQCCVPKAEAESVKPPFDQKDARKLYCTILIH